MQELIGNLTCEQFAQLIGKTCGVLMGCIFVSSFLVAFITGCSDGWAFRKGFLYYGSLKYLNQCFKSLKKCTSPDSLEVCYTEVSSVICLLRYQRTIPKFLYKRLMEKRDLIYQERVNEIL